MSMPEAPVNEDGLSQPRKNQVWCSRQFTTVQAKPITQAVSELANYDFRFGMFVPNASHQGGSLGVNRFPGKNRLRT